MVNIKHFKIPFSWDTRVICIYDQVWFIPPKSTLQEFTFEGFPAIFKNTQPICLEYCSGNGDWIIYKAQNEPHKNWVAVEKRLDRVKKIWSKAKNYNVTNLLIIWSEAHFATKTYFSSDTIDEIFINFPDPWPKRRHAHFRIINTTFVSECHRVLKQNGHVHFVTDNSTYLEQSLKVFNAASGLVNTVPDPYYGDVTDTYESSFFADLFRKQGLTIRKLTYKKELSAQ